MLEKEAEERLEYFASLEAWTMKDYRSLCYFLKHQWLWGHYVKIDGDRLTISTGGWSDHEYIIGRIMENKVFMRLFWYYSQRGGHYEFKPAFKLSEE